VLSPGSLNLIRVTRYALLAIVLIAGILAGGCLELSRTDPVNASEHQLLYRIESLEQENAGLREQLDQKNITIRSYENQLAFYRARFAPVDTPGSGDRGQGEINGRASLDAPAVLQRTVYEQNGPFISERIEMEGSLLNVTVEIVPGRGRVLVETTPLMGEVFQDAANMAVYVAQQKTGRDLSSADVFISIVAQDEVPAVDGGSAGALMTHLMISVIEGTEPRSDMTMTGTIDQDGRVGAIGGVVQKATAAKERGKTLFLLPRDNSQLVRYVETATEYYGYTFVRRAPEEIDAKDYIESEIGIRVEYVDTIEDVRRLG